MLKYVSIILLLLAHSPAAKSEISIDGNTATKYISEFANLVVYVMKRFVSPKTNTLVITEKCAVICSVEQRHQGELLTNILFNLYGEFAIQLSLGRYNDRLWDYNIFIVDSPEAFISLRYTIPDTQHDRFFNFLILLTWSANSAMERNESLFQIFKASLSFNVRNVVVMIKAFQSNHTSFYTYDLFNKGNCRNKISIRELNRYANGTLQNDLLFPGYINNLQGCHLNISAHVLEPLISFRGDLKNATHLVDSNRLSGVEGDILKVVAEALNFKIRLRFPREKNTINIFYESTGSFRDLERASANIAIGGLSSTITNSEKFSKSYVYHTTPFVFVVRSGLCFGPIKQLLNPFCTSTWILLLVFFVISFVFVKIIQRQHKLADFIFGPKIKKPICSMFVIFLGNALPTALLPKRNFARFLLAAWLLLSFELRNGYQGKMFDSLRFSKRIPVPQKLSQLLKQDYSLLSSSYSEFYPKNKTQIMSNTIRRLNAIQMSTSRLTATALLDSLAHYNFLNYNTSTLTYVEEAIHTIPCVMFFQKHSIFRPSIDRILKILSDAGITSYIAKQHVLSWFQDMNSHSQFEIKLANNNLKGVYFVGGLMFLIAIFVFVLELLTRKFRKLRKIMDALNSF